jgi:Na+-transporting NADH:ubiquinone oxidoreductase subunit A
VVARARFRHAPGIALVAPMACRVARIQLLPGRRLGEIVLFREAGGDAVRHKVQAAGDGAEALATLLQVAGFWPRLRRRPYGTMPGAAERPAAIVIMGCDTRPFAPDPRHEIAGREDALLRGLSATSALAQGPVFLCQDPARPLVDPRDVGPGVTIVHVGARHPQGLAGIQLHAICPASDARPVWDLHAGDVADLGTLLETGSLPPASARGSRRRRGCRTSREPRRGMRRATCASPSRGATRRASTRSTGSPAPRGPRTP